MKNKKEKELINKIIPKEDFEEIFLSDKLTFSDKINIFLEWVPEIEIPDHITTSQALLDYVYDIYLKAVDKYSLDKKIKEVKRNKQGESRKDFIINQIQIKGEISYQELYSIVDDKWQYEERGKTPRVRINNVLKSLVAEEKIARDGDVIIWKGK